MFKSEFLDKIKERNEIVDVVSLYVNLKKQGKNYVGLCPFHTEKTGSFCVYPSSDSFYCFGCGAGGDVITFIRLVENLNYIESVQFLARRAGIEVPDSDGYDEIISKKNVIYEINRESARFFHKNLLSDPNKIGLNYLLGRGIKFNTIKYFGIGYSNNSYSSLVKHLISKGYSQENIILSGTAIRSRNGKILDRFFNRIIFPIIDLRGNVIAFGGRTLTDANPKYLNTSDTPVFKKSLNLFALNFAKKNSEKRILLTEGYMDAISLHQAGFTGTVATLGTSLTNQQAKLLLKYSEEVFISYDSDEAGQKATERAIKILRNNGISPKVISIPKAKDPDEFLSMYGEKGKIYFESLIKGSENDIQYSISKLKSEVNLENSDEKVKFINKTLKLLSELLAPVEQDIYLSKLSMEVEVQKSALKAQLEKIIKGSIKSGTKIQNKQSDKSFSLKNNLPKDLSSRAEYIEQILISYIIVHGCSEDVLSSLSRDDFVTDFGKLVFVIILDLALKGEKIDISSISKDLNLNQIGKIAKMLNTPGSLVISSNEFQEYVTMLKREKQFSELKNCEHIDKNLAFKYINVLKNSKR
ncbi:MAG: DNA primase [Oscillospiraceae bacterium]|jgi:DNA primase|nr:DNA primase [Oscillospiraceae bacterium]